MSTATTRCASCDEEGEHGAAQCIQNLRRRALAAEAYVLQLLDSTAGDLLRRVDALKANAADYAEDGSTAAKLAHRQLTSHARFLNDYAIALRDRAAQTRPRSVRA